MVWELFCPTSCWIVKRSQSHILWGVWAKPKTNYAQIEHKALSIVIGVRKFYQYIFGRKFMLLTDHHPLNCDFWPLPWHPSFAASRMQRWVLLLSAHTNDIKYGRSELHGNADGLSRLPLADQVKEAKVADIFYFSQVERAPVTAAQVHKGTRNDLVLSKVMVRMMTYCSNHTPLTVMNFQCSQVVCCGEGEWSFHQLCANQCWNSCMRDTVEWSAWKTLPGVISGGQEWTGKLKKR